MDCVRNMGVFAKVPLFNLFRVGIECLLSRNLALKWEKNTVPERRRGGSLLWNEAVLLLMQAT